MLLNSTNILSTPDWQSVLLGTAVLVAARVLYTLLLSPFRNIPGPFLAKFTNLWQLLYLTSSNEGHKILLELHARHGPVVRVGPNLFSFNSLADQKAIYSAGKGYNKGKFYHSAGVPSAPNIFSLINEVEHADRKKRLASLYTMSSMVHYEPSVDKMNDLLVETLHGMVEKKKWVLVPDLMQRYAFDVIGEITVDQNFGMMQRQPRADVLIKSVHALTDYFGSVGVFFPRLHDVVIFVSGILGLQDPTSVIFKIAQTQIESVNADDAAEKVQGDQQASFLTKLVGMKKAGRLQLQHVFDSIGANIAAGSDTTGITLSAALHYIYQDERVLATLRREIDQASAQGRVSDPVTFAEAQRLPYLQAVIQETLRLHPAVGYLLPRAVPKGGAQLAGHFFPEGTEVGVSAWALHQNPQEFGPDAGKFVPERYLGDDRSPSSAFAFGGGSRTCLGKNISLLEISKVLPQIIRRFDIRFRADEDWKLWTLWFVYPKYECQIELRKDI